MCLFLDAFKYILYWDTFQKKKKTTNFLCLYVNVEAELSQLPFTLPLFPQCHS